MKNTQREISKIKIKIQTVHYTFVVWRSQQKTTLFHGFEKGIVRVQKTTRDSLQEFEGSYIVISLKIPS